MLLSPLVWKSKRAPIVVILLHAGKEKLKPCTATPGLWIKAEEACTSRSRVALHQGQHGRRRAPTTPSPHLPPSPRRRLSGRRPSRVAARIVVAVTARSTPLWPDLPEEGGWLAAGMATTTVEAWLGRRRQGCKRQIGRARSGGSGARGDGSATAGELSVGAPIAAGRWRREACGDSGRPAVGSSGWRRCWRRLWLATAVADGGNGCECGVGCRWQHVEARKVWMRCRRLETGYDDCERRQGRPRAASQGGVADDSIWPARQRREECSEASLVHRGSAGGSRGRHGARRRSQR